MRARFGAGFPAGLLLAVALMAATVAAGMTAAAATVPAAGRLAFSVFRNGDSTMGWHRLDFHRDGDRLVVEKEIRFEVKVAFFTAYRYVHTNREVWQGDRLVALETSTDDDGRRHWVRGRATPEGFAVESSRGALLAPADVVPTSYWNIRTVGTTRLLDTQRGVLMDVRVEPLGAEPVAAAGSVVEARHFRLHFLSNRPGATDFVDIWYDDADAWVKLAFRAKGQDIVYRLDAPGALPQQPPAQPAVTRAADTPQADTPRPGKFQAAAPSL
ncbi:DUF6134 family protein [Rhodospirillum centenum]|uniref:DUF3108 domain-containing protein n=1 Tax=Rhodospirillum centenum (strain ATCC 51521 / SW) TaxID=414684 RepID=B6IRE1_RHOCS|nr:DUF6134 family protein [Rhodospirillum centenum]ACI98027.1 hypothetical protein RC1_0591 [Rhodospirillum centenum SW]